MGYLLDTCVLSEFKKKQPEQKVIDWLDAQIEETLFLSVVTISEIRKGISRLPASKRKTELETWLEELITDTTNVCCRWTRKLCNGGDS